MKLEKIVRRVEQMLWMRGLIGSACRILFRRAWLRIEHIPDNEKLWRALHKPEQVYKETGKPKPAFFRDRSGLSVDIARLTTPERARVGNSEKPYPDATGLVEISTQSVRAAGVDVRHEPVRVPRANFAHAQFTAVPNQDSLERLASEAVFRIPQRFKAVGA